MNCLLLEDRTGIKAGVGTYDTAEIGTQKIVEIGVGVPLPLVRAFKIPPASLFLPVDGELWQGLWQLYSLAILICWIQKVKTSFSKQAG